MASISSSVHSQSGSIATVAVTANSETTASLDACNPGKDSKVCDDGITVNAKTILAGAKPVYPVSLRNLRELLKGPPINVFVGEKPCLDLVFPISKDLLAYFSPALRTALQSHFGNKYVVLQKADKKAVSWVLRWMLSGGIDKSYVNAPVVGDVVDCLSKRLKVVVELGIQGSLQHSMYEALKKAVIKGAVNTNQLSWIFASESPPYAKALGKNLSVAIVDAILDGEMTTIIPSVKSNPIFTAEIEAALVIRKGRLYAKQHHEWEPLSLFQLDFVYAFTKSGHEIRKMVVHDLIRLHYWQCIPNEQIYITYAAKNTDFNDDWDRAEQDKFEYRANKAKSRAAGEKKPEVNPKKGERRSQRRPNPANKEHNAHRATAHSTPSAHDCTTPQVDKSLPESASTRHHNRQRGKTQGLSSKSGSTTPHIVNTAIEKTSGTHCEESNAEDQEEAGANTGAREDAKTRETNAPPVAPPPGKRIESDAVLCLTAEGEVKRER
ncbi:hypothetical protein MMC11_001393 [Xylographa trunciseda]|nr:hypothetical protein [Xylographa trunciseda]